MLEFSVTSGYQDLIILTDNLFSKYYFRFTTLKLKKKNEKYPEKIRGTFPFN